MGDVQIIKTEGEDLVVLPRRDYDALLARAGDPQAEDMMSARILAETAGQTALPLAVWDRIDEGENLFLVLMEHRGLSPEELAHRTALGDAFVSRLLRGEVEPDADALEKLRIALDASPDVLEG